MDTNVISELTRNVPHPGVVAFLEEQDELWLPSVVIHELEYGIQLLPPGNRRDHLYFIQRIIVSEYDDRILALDRDGAEWAAQFRAQFRRSGRVLDLGDAFIAGIAKANGLTIATRNVADFQGVEVDVINPWDMP